MSLGRPMARLRLIGTVGTLLVTLAAFAAFAGATLATPLFLSAQDVSDPGQDGFEPQVVEDLSAGTGQRN